MVSAADVVARARDEATACVVAHAPLGGAWPCGYVHGPDGWTSWGHISFHLVAAVYRALRRVAEEAYREAACSAVLSDPFGGNFDKARAATLDRLVGQVKEEDRG